MASGRKDFIEQDLNTAIHFNSSFRNAKELRTALDKDTSISAQDKHVLCGVYESVFNHRQFTGRSGSMYKYEGLGCIYWHMVSKLLLAVQEITLRAAEEGESDAVYEGLAKMYHRIRGGLGFEKTVAEYGAFPTDPYSHTPRHAGAQQPGMTGQVKEEILTRFGELGVRIEAGTVSFRPVLLTRRDFRQDAGTYRFYDLGGKLQSIDVPANALAFSFCQVPVVYQLTQNEAWIRVTTGDGASSDLSGNRLDVSQSQTIFDRCGSISRIDVGVPDRSLFDFS